MEKCLKCKHKKSKLNRKKKIRSINCYSSGKNLSGGMSQGQASDVGVGQEIRDWFHCWLSLPWVAHVPPHFPVGKPRLWKLETMKYLKIYSEKLDFYFYQPWGNKRENSYTGCPQLLPFHLLNGNSFLMLPAYQLKLTATITECKPVAFNEFLSPHLCAVLRFPHKTEN